MDTLKEIVAKALDPVAFDPRNGCAKDVLAALQDRLLRQADAVLTTIAAHAGDAREVAEKLRDQDVTLYLDMHGDARKTTLFRLGYKDALALITARDEKIRRETLEEAAQARKSPPPSAHSREGHMNYLLDATERSLVPVDVEVAKIVGLLRKMTPVWTGQQFTEHDERRCKAAADLLERQQREIDQLKAELYTTRKPIADDWRRIGSASMQTRAKYAEQALAAAQSRAAELEAALSIIAGGDGDAQIIAQQALALE
jgi:hypothetical protein